MSVIDRFADPPPEYSPVPFWFLNERLDPKRLKWQLQQMHQQHVFGCIMHARPGLVTPYLSDEWFDMIRTIVNKAGELGMSCWTYDEYPWHSGMAEWRVPRLHPDFRIRALDYLQRRVLGPQRLVWNLADDLPEEAGVIVSCILNPLYGGKLLGPGQDISSHLKGHCLTYEMPQGEHQVAVYFERLSYNPYGDKFGRFPVTDLMHPRAVQAFIDLTHREYERRMPTQFGKTIKATFTDEPPADTPGWSRVLLDEFRRRKGYDLKPYLPLLFSDGGPVTGKVRYDYASVVESLYEENYFGAIEQWADKMGVWSTGHLLLEETMLFHARFMGDYFKALRRMHVPGIDYIFPGRIPPVVPKMAASVANLYGKQRVLSECFALTGWNFTFEHMKWMTDWQLVHGINLIVPHAFFYAINEDEPIPEVPDSLGFRWYDCPPSMFYQQPYWRYYSYYADYVRRCCYLLSQGEHVCRIGVYYPIESVQADFVPTKEYCNLHAFEVPGGWERADYLWDGPAGVRTDAHFRATCDLLRNSGLDFDIVDDDSLRNAVVEEGKLIVRGRRTYEALILPHTQWLATDVYRTIASFASQGGHLMATGALPQHALEGPEMNLEVKQLTKAVFGVPPEQAAAILTRSTYQAAEETRAALFPRPGDELVSLLKRRKLHDFSADNPDLFAHHRHLEEGELYFLSYQSGEPAKVALTLGGSGVVSELDPYDGSSFVLRDVECTQDQVSLQLSFEPYQSRFILISSENNRDATTVSTGGGPAVFSRSVTERTSRLGHPVDDSGKTPEAVAHSSRPGQADPGLLQTALRLEGPWKVKLDLGGDHPFRLRDIPLTRSAHELEEDRLWEQLAPWEDLGLSEFSGGATYKKAFVWNGSCSRPVWLDLGEVGITAEVKLNGRQLGVRLWRPYRFELSGALREGDNELEIRVVNTLANAIAAQYGKTAADGPQKAFSTFPPGSLRSGLIGPVRLLTDSTRCSPLE